MINFTVGPVMSGEEVRKIASLQIPYFRTPEFSSTMLENEQMMLGLFHAPARSRVVFLTGSGTASMEASVINTLGPQDRALVVSGGSFGERFCEILSLHKIPYTAIKCEYGKTLTAEQLLPYENKGYTAFLFNLCETSTGVLYDLELISAFCKRNALFLIVDGVSSFLCDTFDMEKSGVNVVLTGSQKALALAPGVSVICMDERAQERVYQNETRSYYLDLKSHLKNMERGQTPFTPAVSVLLQLNARLRNIMQKGGAEYEVKKAASLAKYFREHISELPFRQFADRPSNAVTSLAVNYPVTSAYRIFEILKDEYGIFICPNGGDLKEKVFRVGHMGDLTVREYDRLLEAFFDLRRRGIV